MQTALLVAGPFVLSLVATRLVLRYALRRQLLDLPNARSSHTRPTPRGGGLAVAAVILVGIAALTFSGWLPRPTGLAVVGGGLLIAGVGWLDDHRSLPASLRAGVHVVAAGWAVWWLGGLPALRVGDGVARLGWAGGLLALLGVVWATNLYNFMDGIDGLAAGEAVVVGLIGGGLLLAGDRAELAGVAFLTAGASGGFLVWNWSPARIFMGDVGSGLLGFMFAVLAVASENAGGVPVLGWLMLLGVFVFDATATLLRRAAGGERWYEAHRSHAYQRAVQSGWSHRSVTSCLLLLTAVLGVGTWVACQRPGLLAAMAGLAGLGLGAVYLLVERRRPMVP